MATKPSLSPTPLSEETVDAYWWAEVLADVEGQGWEVISVLGVQNTPNYSYTVGLCAHALPDLLLVGVHPLEAIAVLNAVVRWLGVRKGRVKATRRRARSLTLSNGAVLPVFWSRPLTAKDVDQVIAFELAFSSARFAVERRYACWRVCHLVVSDIFGTFPWEAGCGESHAMTQDLARLIRLSRLTDKSSNLR